MIDDNKYWVDDNLEPVFDDDFKKSIDDDILWGMENELKYETLVNKNIKIPISEVNKIEYYLKSIKDFKRLTILDRIKDKNENLFSNIQDLEINSSRDLKDKVYFLYRDILGIPNEFLDNHVEIDFEIYLSKKERNEKLLKLLNK